MSRGLYKSYQNAGVGFLAYKMERIFTRLENPEQVTLHNDILADVLAIIEGEETQFFKDMADAILYPKGSQKKAVRRKRFLFRLADKVLNIGMKKG